MAVKYVRTRTNDSDSLGRAVREVMFSKKLHHPNVVQCFSWTVLSQPVSEPGEEEQALTEAMAPDMEHSEGNAQQLEGKRASAEDENRSVAVHHAKKGLHSSFAAIHSRQNGSSSTEEFGAIPAVWPSGAQGALPGPLASQLSESSVSITPSSGRNGKACGVKRRRTSEGSTAWTPSPGGCVLDPRMDSFNSEEGFGSPIKRKSK